MRIATAALGTGVLVGARATAWACSGPGAMDRILGAELLGWILFAASLLVMLAAGAIARRYRRRWRGLWPVPLVVALHPGWWMSARAGDCGAILTLGSVAITLVALVAAILLVVLSRRGASRRAAESAARASV